MWSDDDLRSNNLDFMRFCMAVLVIFSHAFTLLSGIAFDTEPLRHLTGNQVSFGELAVDVFFIISGFLITLSWERSSSPLTYLRKRAARIVPGYLVAVLIGVFLVAPWFVDSPVHWADPRVLWKFFITTATLGLYTIPTVFPHNPVPGALNGSLWTIRFEFLCYLGVLGLGLCGLIRRRGVILALFALLFVVNAVIAAGLWSYWRINVACRLDVFFAAGAVFYLYRTRIPKSPALAVISAVACAATMISGHGIFLALPVALTYLVFYAAFQRRVRFPRFARHGDFSYGIYLYGFLIEQVLIALWGRDYHPLRLFLTASVLSILAGVLSWHLVEKHFVHRKVKPAPPSTPLSAPLTTPVPEVQHALASEPAALTATSAV